eukprot:CAMPEP_0182529542 /NCGR_PEP_ID=MMETSP1323-20130603/5259_1 /TAXON_ID=236787 /ORGANISM="Florenciella parvula, Strain RCC1693" /LENGTH=969 /DNA_ID=CAMNT_0024738755 /DNA_START=20 /DNA_END=2929 /DNA_ORIENTATION=+
MTYHKLKRDAGAGSMLIKWEDIVKRCVNYVKMQLAEAEAVNDAVCIRVFELFRTHLIKARFIEPDLDDAAVDPDAPTELFVGGLSADQLKQYHAAQSRLNGQGVMEVCLETIANDDVEAKMGPLTISAIQLAVELQVGGNRVTQGSVVEYINSQAGAKFMEVLHQRICRTTTMLEVHRLAQTSSSTYLEPNESLLLAIKTTEAIFELLGCMCEGHNNAVQNILRVQTAFSTTSINVLQDCIELLATMCSVVEGLDNLNYAEIGLIGKSLDTICEAVQGPCRGNQELVADSHAIMAVNNLLASDLSAQRISREERMSCKCKAVTLVHACLEARSVGGVDDGTGGTSQKVHKDIGGSLEPRNVDRFFQTARRYIEDEEQLFMAAHSGDGVDLGVHMGGAGKAVPHLPDADEEELEAVKGEVLEALVVLNMVQQELSHVAAFSEQERPEHDAVAQHDFLDRYVGHVEVCWNGHVQQVSFPVPPYADYFKDSSRQQFLKTVDLDGPEKRMKQLAKESFDMISEMKSIYQNARSSPFYLFMHRNISAVKQCLYYVVVLLNLNLLMEPNVIRDTLSTVTDPNDETRKYLGSIYITIILSAVTCLGYVILTGFLAYTEIPIVIRELDQVVAEAKEKVEAREMKRSEFRDFAAFTNYIYLVVFAISFTCMHRGNYPGVPITRIWWVLLVVPYGLICARNYFKVPDTKMTRWFCILMDVLVEKPFFRNHLMLMIFSVWGLVDSVHFSVMLLDVFNIVPIMGEILKSITVPGMKLFSVLYLFIMTMYIYAAFGLKYFEGEFLYAGMDDDGQDGCHSTMSCFWLIAYQGIPNGGYIEASMVPQNNSEENYNSRVVYSLTFFMWVGVVLFNVITGLIVDSFTSLRADSEEREGILKEECFVCGLKEQTYDELIDQGASFAKHQTMEHDWWSYVLYLAYLRDKEPTLMDGLESYVLDRLKVSDFDWVPRGTCHSIQYLVPNK